VQQLYLPSICSAAITPWWILAKIGVGQSMVCDEISRILYQVVS
jgi:hypothetical protein